MSECIKYHGWVLLSRQLLIFQPVSRGKEQIGSFLYDNNSKLCNFMPNRQINVQPEIACLAALCPDLTIYLHPKKPQA